MVEGQFYITTDTKNEVKTILLEISKLIIENQTSINIESATRTYPHKKYDALDTQEGINLGESLYLLALGLLNSSVAGIKVRDFATDRNYIKENLTTE